MSGKVKILVGVVAALLLAVGVVAGTALAQNGGGQGPGAAGPGEPGRGPGPAGPWAQGEGPVNPPSDELCARFLEGVASRLGVTVEEVEEAFRATKLDMLDEAVEAGKIDPETAEHLRSRIEEGSACWHPHPRPHQGGPRLLRGLVLYAAAETLDMTPRELVGELRQCQSLAQVAAAQGVEREDLISGILDEAEERLDQAVENGRITEEQADQMLQGLTDHMDEIVDRVHCPEAASGAPSGTSLEF